MDNQELPDLLKIVASFIATIGGMQIIAGRNKKLRREDMKDFELRLEHIEGELRFQNWMPAHWQNSV